MVFGLVTPQDGLVTPQYGELRPTSLKNIQNLQKSLKSRQNSIDADIDDDRMDADRCILMRRMEPDGWVKCCRF